MEISYPPNLNLENTMILSSLVLTPVLAAAGWAALVYLGGGGAGLAIVVFVVLKLLGR